MIPRLSLIIPTVLILNLYSSYGQNNSYLKEQAQKFVTKLKSNEDYPMGGKDTLIDLNGDHLKDILIEFYGSGTGESNGVRLYLYNKLKQKFVPCEQLNYLANPTFYLDKKIVVGYYVGNGGGSATKLKWKGSKLDTLEHIDIDINNKENSLTFQITSHNYITKKKFSKTLDSMELPKEYNYYDYKPIIKTESQ